MNVGQLREKLENLPDDMPVALDPDCVGVPTDAWSAQVDDTLDRATFVIS